MAVEPTPNPMGRATQIARAEPSERWIELSQSIMSRVRTLVTPSDPIVVHTSDGAETVEPDGSRTYVSARVVSTAVRRLLQQHGTHAPAGIDLRVEEDHLTSIELTLVGAYGTDLVALAAAVRRDVLEVVTELIGPDPRFGRQAISITFADVVDGDPRLV